jgi:hypothetical protein
MRSRSTVIQSNSLKSFCFGYIWSVGFHCTANNFYSNVGVFIGFIYCAIQLSRELIVPEQISAPVRRGHFRIDRVINLALQVDRGSLQQ